MNNNPIGVMDSGIGGLSIWKELVKELPAESTIYFADNKNCPYGPKSLKEIHQLAEKVTKFLINKNVKLILVACNTITVSVIAKLRDKFEIPFVGVEPATKVAAENTKTDNIGILATQGTFRGNLFNRTKEKFGSNTNIHLQIGEGLVEMVETNSINSKAAQKLLQNYVDFFLKNNVDQVALGCTHYPFFKEELVKLSGNKINFINPANAVVKQLKRILENNNLFSTSKSAGEHQIFSSGKITDLKTFMPHIDLYFPELIENYLI